MGLGITLPSPGEGMLCVVMVNTAISINILKHILRSILHVVGIHYPCNNSDDDPCTPSFTSHATTTTSTTLELEPRKEIYVEEFRHRNPAVRFYTVCRLKWSCSRDDNCSVCLTKFKPVSEVNQLECGHVFHKECLERWMEYWNTTCPLCRTPIMPIRPPLENNTNTNEDDEEEDTIMY